MEVPMTSQLCCNCYMPFSIPTEMYNALRRSHNDFYCPRGHSQHFTGKSDVEIANEARDEAIRLKLAAQAELEQLEKKKCKKAKK